MPGLRRRIKKRMRKKHKKTVALSKVDKLWKEYVQYGLIEELIKKGKVQVDKNFSIEIVGQKLTDNPRLMEIFKRGIGSKGSLITPTANLHKGRQGYVYSIVVEDKNFKEGKLMFDADPAIKKAVFTALATTSNYYRIK